MKKWYFIFLSIITIMSFVAVIVLTPKGELEQSIRKQGLQ
jgi:hypothetical protein